MHRQGGGGGGGGGGTPEGEATERGAGSSPARRPSGVQDHPSRDARRWLQVVVGGVLVVAVAAYAGGLGKGGTGGLASKLYEWTNSNDKSRDFRTSTIGGMDADDPAFGPRKYRVPPVDRVIARLKGHDDPEYYDREHHGPVAQFINRPTASRVKQDAAENDGDALASGTAFVVDPDATDDAQFNINLLLRKSGRMSQDASELAELQREDAQITAEYEHASTRAASLLTLEGDMKHEMQQLSAKQVQIIQELQNVTANETVASEGADGEAAAIEDNSAEGSGTQVEGEGDAPGGAPDPDAPTAADVSNGAEQGAEKRERGRTPMLALRGNARAAHFSPAVRRGVVQERVDSSVAARAALAQQKAVLSAANVGSILDEARKEVERQAAARRRRPPEHVEAQRTVAHLDAQREEVQMREGKRQLEARELEKREMAQALERQHALLRQEMRLRKEVRQHVRHTGAP
jgi:hypothetical protein